MSHPKRMLGAMGEQCMLLADESFLLPHKPQVLIGFFAFSVIEYFNSLYMLESNPLVVVQLIKIFFSSLSFFLFVKKQVAVGSWTSLLVFRHILLIRVSILYHYCTICTAMAI